MEITTEDMVSLALKHGVRCSGEDLRWMLRGQGLSDMWVHDALNRLRDGEIIRLRVTPRPVWIMAHPGTTEFISLAV